MRPVGYDLVPRLSHEESIGEDTTIRHRQLRPCVTEHPAPVRRNCRIRLIAVAPRETHNRFTTGRVSSVCNLLLAGMIATCPAVVSAGSFRIYDHSASATGQTSVFTAQVDDASAGTLQSGRHDPTPRRATVGRHHTHRRFSFQNAAGTAGQWRPSRQCGRSASI